jgi:uncharacterized membrane protein
MARVLVLASIVWPVLLGVTVWQRAEGRAPLWTALVYAAGSRICHQKPERTFHSAGVPWPVCARCSGLYLAAPFGALVASWSLKRRTAARRRLLWLAVASLPTAVTLGVEWAGIAAPSNLMRALAALPVGAMIAFVLIRTAAGESKAIE